MSFTQAQLELIQDVFYERSRILRRRIESKGGNDHPWQRGALAATVAVAREAEDQANEMAEVEDAG